MGKSELVLVGGGHAHVQVLHALKNANVNITLISDVQHAPYSGMIPSYLSGSCSEKELVFDLRELCARFGYRFILQTVTSIDDSKCNIRLADGTHISYDFCSLNVGIRPQEIPSESIFSNVIYVKPIANFLREWRIATEKIPSAGRVVVVGGGAAAFELAIACGLRFPGRVALVTGDNGFTLPRGANGPARRALANLAIELFENQRVQKIDDGLLRLSNSSISFVLALVAISARPSDIFADSLLPTSHEGHVLIDNYLRVKDSSTLFAAGDCAHFESCPLPKSGVYAVRQGALLAQNLLSFFGGRTGLRPYVPQKNVLAILVTGSNEAMFCWRGLAFRSVWAARLKRWIDRRFMRKFS